MGGTGSGRWSRYTTKPLIEQQIKINVHKWQKQNRLTNGNFFEWNLLEGKNTYWPATAKVSGGTLDVVYEIYNEDFIMNRELITNHINLGWTETPLGGTRVWFVCPSCKLRVADLYLAGKYLLCRHCYRLGYKSQRRFTTQDV